MFQLDMKSHRSIYEQIIDNVKELILRGVLEENSRLPSVRDLSRDLAINPNTVQKAFKELEREGVIYTVPGRGAFVAPHAARMPDPAKVKRIRDTIAGCYRELMIAGVSADDARKLILETIEKEGGQL